jgi:hypothetical protein
MSFNLQSLAPETRSNVPTSVLLDHFKAATAAGVPIEGKDARGSANEERPAAGSRRTESKGQTAGFVLDVDGGEWEDYCLCGDVNEDSNMTYCGGNEGCSEIHNDVIYQEGDYIHGGAVTLTSALSSAAISSSSSSSSRAIKDIDLSPLKSSGPLGSRIPGDFIKVGLSGVSAMTRTLCIWVKTWSAGESSVEHCSNTSDLAISKALPVLFPPTEEQAAVIRTYGVQLLSESKLDYAAAYLRTLSRLVEQMRSVPAAYITKTTSKGCAKRTFESQLEDTQKFSDGGSVCEYEGRVRTRAQVWRALRLWEGVVDTVESAMQSKAMDTYGARLAS